MKFMKKIIRAFVNMLVLSLFHVHASAQPGHSFSLLGLESLKVPVTVNKMTNLVFPVNIRKGVKVSREIAAQKVAGVENTLELKALRVNFAPTNLSVYGVDGRLYSFDLVYAEDPPVLNFAVVNRDGGNGTVIGRPDRIILSGFPVDESTLARDADSIVAIQGFLHKSTSEEKIRLYLHGIYLRDSLLWLQLSISNHSLIPFRSDWCRLFIVDRRRGKRMAFQDVNLEPVYNKMPAVVKGLVPFALGIPLTAISHKKLLVLQIMDAGGGRMLTLKIKPGTLLRARSI